MQVQESFRSLVRSEGARLYRDLPWRRTRDPYAVWVSEVMLQQTQVARVETRWDAWMERFPNVYALARAPSADVLAAWQGMGYNRRALNLKAAAEQIVRTYDGMFPRDAAALEALPGIGPATAQGIRSFAYDLPGVYLETNVRSVFLFHFFPDVEGVSDRELAPLVEAACPAAPADGSRDADASGRGAGSYAAPQDADDTPRSWYYALLDYGSHLKRTVPNPSRRSSSQGSQSAFEGSRRQKRAEVVRILLAAREQGEDGLPFEGLAHELDEVEEAAGRAAVDGGLLQSILDDLSREGFCSEDGGFWHIA